MNQGVYELRIRPTGTASLGLDRTAFGQKIQKIPGVSARDNGFVFGEEDEHGVMVIEPAGEAPLDGVAISVPRAWVMPRGPQVFALVFMMAEWSGGEVFDPQIDAPLQKEAVLQGLVAVRQAQREAESQEARSDAPVEDYVPTTPAPAVEPEESKRPWWKKW